MDSIEEFKLRLREELMLLQGSKPHLDKHIMVRCPFCGDSVKHLDHGHMGVKINMDDDKDAIVYKCFRCDDSGLFRSKTLAELGIDDIELRASLDKYNSQCNKQGFGDIFSKSYQKFDYTIPDNIIDINSVIPKIEYLNNRLGIDANYKVYKSLNVVFSTPEFIIHNKINKITRTQDKMRIIHKDYVGFLTTRRELIINRDITNTHKDLRYDVYKIHGGDENKYTKLFTLPFRYDVMSTEQFDVHICEGTMDALGIYFNINNQLSDNNLYMAVCGSGFKAGVKYLIDRGIFGNNVNFHFYSDSDKDPRFYKSLFKKTRKYVGHIYLYYNKKAKDCGVPKNRIELIKSKIY